MAIQYLCTLDCSCNPKVVEALLGALDDCAEVVRYEALLALNGDCKGCWKQKKGCKNNGCCSEHCKHKHVCKHGCDHGCKQGCHDCAGCCSEGVQVGDCPDPSDCCGCQCQKKVIERLNDLLLERLESGCLKERSQRVRCLATRMIEECLCRRQPPPVLDGVEPVKPTESKPDEKPARKEEKPAAPTKPTAATRSVLPRLDGSSKPIKPVSSARVHRNVAEESNAVVLTAATVAAPATKSPEEVVLMRQEIITRSAPRAAGQPQAKGFNHLGRKVEQPDLHGSDSVRSTKRRHLIGELFGY